MIWNPWKELRIAEQAIANLREVIAERDEELAQCQRKASELSLRLKIAETSNSLQRQELAQGHFRNPKTGRLGRKGERFK